MADEEEERIEERAATVPAQWREYLNASFYEGIVISRTTDWPRASSFIERPPTDARRNGMDKAGPDSNVEFDDEGRPHARRGGSRYHSWEETGSVGRFSVLKTVKKQ